MKQKIRYLAIIHSFKIVLYFFLIFHEFLSFARSVTRGLKSIFPYNRIFMIWLMIMIIIVIIVIIIITNVIIIIITAIYKTNVMIIIPITTVVLTFLILINITIIMIQFAGDFGTNKQARIHMIIQGKKSANNSLKAYRTIILLFCSQRNVGRR